MEGSTTLVRLPTMGSRAGRVVGVVCAAAALLLSGACRKTTAPPHTALPDAGIVVAGETPEAFELCREAYPCAPGQRDMCAIGGAPQPPASYGAPGVRIERLFCRYSKMGEDAVLGVPEDGSAHLRHLELFLRVRGSPAERARAAAELVLERELSGACVPSEDADGVLRFCVRGAFADRDVALRCLVFPSGATSCTSDGTDRALEACRRSFGKDRVVASEMYVSPATQGAVAMGTTVIASDHAIGGASTGAPAQRLRAAGLHLRQAECSETGVYPFRHAHWGEEGDGGALVFGKELLPRLDTVEMRAALAFDLALPEGEPATYLLLDPTGGADAMVVPRGGCRLPPGPREDGGSLEFYTSHAAATGPALRHCRVTIATGHGLCGAVTPGTFCGP